MRLQAIAMLLGLALATLISGCSGMQGGLPGDTPSIPSLGGGITNVGNPTEEPDIPKAQYVNETYDVEITYPANNILKRQGETAVDFSSTDGVMLTASFVELASGESFDHFLNETRGGRAGLEVASADNFDEELCTPKASTENNLKTVECYYFRDDGSQRIVLAVIGVANEDVMITSLHAAKKIASQQGPESPLMKTLHWINP